MALIVTGAPEEIRPRAGAVSVTLATRAESAKVVCGRIAPITAILDARHTTDSQMMIAAKRIAACRNIARPVHHLGLGMA
jgi:hypothetical protein